MILTTIVGDFFRSALATWVLLVFFEWFRPGMVQRFINLEYFFYGLILVFIFYSWLKK